MPALPYTVLDVFTEAPLRGNPLAVVHDAEDVDDETMLLLARETRLSETSFVQPSRTGDADYRHRIFMPSGEIPFAGHPSLGTAVAVAARRGLRSGRLVQETGAGEQPVEVALDGARANASMLQEPLVLGPEVDPADALAAAGLSSADADPELGPRFASTGASQLLVPVRSPEALGRAAPDHGAIDRLLAPQDAITLYLFHHEPCSSRSRARALLRTAQPAEDPATGSAAGPLCAWLAQVREVERVEIEQGVEMGRPSRIEAALEDGRVRVGGGVVTLVEGEIRL